MIKADDITTVIKMNVLLLWPKFAQWRYLLLMNAFAFYDTGNTAFLSFR